VKLVSVLLTVLSLEAEAATIVTKPQTACRVDLLLLFG